MMNTHLSNGDTTPTMLTHPSLTLTAPGSIAIAQIYPDFHHNKTTLSLVSIVCIPLGVNIAKAGKSPAHLGACSFSSSPVPKPGGNTIAGACGMATGQVQLIFIDALGQVFDVDMHFVEVGGRWHVGGHAVKRTGGQRGLVVGLIEHAPPTPIITLGQGCWDKTARVFTMAGQIVMVTT